MWKSEFGDLEEMFVFLLKEINYDSKNGFSFCSVSPGFSFDEAIEILGTPEVYNTESDQQQTAEYNSLIDHPVHGKRPHHRLNLLLWAFNREPIQIIKLHFNYYNTGLSVAPFKDALNAFLNTICEKLGPPDSKKLATGKQELSYKWGKHKLHIWNNTEGVRVEMR